uniref:Uncharacterized protein n=1 Tax=Triticum urartu TaxID=4572 RepID=A0A8R7K157_TRIUA
MARSAAHGLNPCTAIPLALAPPFSSSSTSSLSSSSPSSSTSSFNCQPVRPPGPIFLVHLRNLPPVQVAGSKAAIHTKSVAASTAPNSHCSAPCTCRCSTDPRGARRTGRVAAVREREAVTMGACGTNL